MGEETGAAAEREGFEEVSLPYLTLPKGSLLCESLKTFVAE